MPTKKIRTKILSATQNSSPYIKELNPITGGVLSSILMQKLDFWFIFWEEHGNTQKDGSFFKFLSKCNHLAYRDGNSWTEELGFTEREFRTAFDRIGIRYRSKKDFLDQDDPFQGKFYCSYYDRLKKLTFYLRNNKLADFAIDRAFNGDSIKIVPNPHRSAHCADLGTADMSDGELRNAQFEYSIRNKYKELNNKKKRVSVSHTLGKGGANEKNELSLIDNTSEFSYTPQESTKVAEFIETVLNKKDGVFFRAVVSKYKKLLIFKTMDEIKIKLEAGVIDYCTPQYFLNALDQEDVMPDKILHDFKAFCLERFGDDEYTEVAQFYNNVLRSKFDTKASRSKSGVNPTKRKSDNIDYLLSKIGRGNFVKAMRNYTELYKSGRLAYKPNITLFTKFAEKMCEVKSNQRTLVETPKKPTQPSDVIPVPHGWMDSWGPAHDPANWTYTCMCGNTIVQYNQGFCKYCNAIIDWSQLDMSFFEKQKEVSA